MELVRWFLFFKLQLLNVEKVQSVFYKKKNISIIIS